MKTLKLFVTVSEVVQFITANRMVLNKTISRSKSSKKIILEHDYSGKLRCIHSDKTVLL